MTKIIHHNLKFQEQRRTLYLNLADKDLYGRHRGVVLYGLDVRPASASSVRIRPGALHTPYGTKFFWDVVTADNAALNTLDLNALLIGGNSIFAAANYNLRPIFIAIIAEVQPTDPSRQPEIQAEAQMGASTIRFRARVVATSRATGHPTLNLTPVDPVGMTDLQTPDTDFDPVRTYDDYAGLPTRVLTGGTPANESLNRNEVLLGYVVLGTKLDGTPATVLNAGAEWAEGVTFIRATNAWEQMSDFLGHDVLLGRNVVRAFGPPVVASPSLRQIATTFQANGGGASFVPSTTPNYGLPPPTGLISPWAQTWPSYRPPSFMKDGEQLVWQFRRLDVILRQWMNRTGDQTLVSLIQDGAGADQEWQSPVHRILLKFSGLETNNLNAMEWADGTPSGTIINHLLKSGVAAHDLKGLGDVLGTGFGDTHAMAINALDIGLLHVFRDLLGFDGVSRPGIDRALLRAPAAIPGGTPALQHNDGPLGDQINGTTRIDLQPTLTGAAVQAYLVNEPLVSAVEKVAQRANNGGQNLLRNPQFQVGDLNAGTLGDLPYWTLSAGSWARSTLVAALGLQTVVFALPAAATVTQSLTENTNLPSLISAGTLISVCVALRVTAGDVAIRALGSSAAPAELFRAVSKTVDVAARYENVSFSFKVSTATALAQLSLNIVAGASGATVSVAGVWMGVGLPPENVTFNPDGHAFVGRDGGAASAMRDHLDLGGFLPRNMSLPVVGADGANKTYVDGEIATVVSYVDSEIVTVLEESAALIIPNYDLEGPGTSIAQGGLFYFTTLTISLAQNLARPVKVYCSGNMVVGAPITSSSPIEIEVRGNLTINAPISAPYISIRCLGQVNLNAALTTAVVLGEFNKDYKLLGLASRPALGSLWWCPVLIEAGTFVSNVAGAILGDDVFIDCAGGVTIVGEIRAKVTVRAAAGPGLPPSAEAYSWHDGYHLCRTSSGNRGGHGGTGGGVGRNGSAANQSIWYGTNKPLVLHTYDLARGGTGGTAGQGPGGRISIYSGGTIAATGANITASGTDVGGSGNSAGGGGTVRGVAAVGIVGGAWRAAGGFGSGSEEMGASGGVFLLSVGYPVAPLLDINYSSQATPGTALQTLSSFAAITGLHSRGIFSVFPPTLPLRY